MLKAKVNTGTHQYTSHLSELPQGLYLYEVRTNNKVEYVKFVKQ